MNSWAPCRSRKYSQIAPQTTDRPAMDQAANETMSRSRFSRETLAAYIIIRNGKFTAATCLKDMATPVSTPVKSISHGLNLDPSTAAKNATCDRSSGKSIKISVLADAPCISGCAESKAKSNAADSAHGLFMNRRATRNRAQADPAEKSNAIR